MGKTIIGKNFSEHAGRDVAVNEDILIYPDLTSAYELPAYMEQFPAQMKEFGVEKPKTSRAGGNWPRSLLSWRNT